MRVGWNDVTTMGLGDGCQTCCSFVAVCWALVPRLDLVCVCSWELVSSTAMLGVTVGGLLGAGHWVYRGPGGDQTEARAANDWYREGHTLRLLSSCSREIRLGG